MSFIPNTTPTPNWLYNGEMKKMSDVELRVVLVVTRATLGWEEDHETGMRKTEDWISRSQIIERTGRGGRSISRAISSCIKHGWIEARNKEGELLDTPEKRSGNRIYFRLGCIFTDKLKTSAKRAQVDKPVPKDTQTSAKRAPQPVPKGHTTKETLTKETLTKEYATQSVAENEINLLIGKFKSINPSYERLFRNRTQRDALARLLKKHGFDQISHLLDFIPLSNKEQYAPVITTPVQFETKLASLLLFFEKENNKTPMAVKI